MTREVLLRKLAYLRQLLADLEPCRSASLDDVVAEHYKIERLMELMVTTATVILQHLLAERKRVPGSYREAFKLAAEAGIIPHDLGKKLQEAAGMRNILVHLYETIDYHILHQSVNPTLDDFSQFVKHLENDLDE